MVLLRKALLIFILPILCFAADGKKEESIFGTLGGDLLSPITTDAKYILLGGTLATAAVYLNKRNKAYRKTKSFEDSKPLNEFGIIGDWVGYGFLNGVYIVSRWYYGYVRDDRQALRDAEIMARASTYTLLMTTGLKSIVSEKRPGYPDDDHSFPSGHAAGAFCFAGVVAARHGWGWGFAAHAAAGFIAVSRNSDDFHYLHDIIAGATIGAAFAWGVSERAMKNESFLFSILPVSRDGLMAGLTAEF